MLISDEINKLLDNKKLTKKRNINRILQIKI